MYFGSAWFILGEFQSLEIEAINSSFKIFSFLLTLTIT